MMTNKRTITWAAVVLAGHVLNIILLAGWLLLGSLALGTIETQKMYEIHFVFFGAVWIGTVFLVSAALTAAFFRRDRHAWVGWLAGTAIAVFIILFGLIVVNAWPTWSVWACLAPGSCGAGIPPIAE
jgi:hypothetical protein